MINDDDFQPYTIRRIRLVNFHNFQDETVELKDGGHLFLLGENGSGKTTILDAVQYVLTAGDLELNAAARVAGAKNDGRRVQGIVMRYNVDTGPLNKEGGVSYAALELTGRGGQPLTLAVGLSAYSMEERIQRWGVIREAPLEEIPLLVEEDGLKRVLGQRELKERMEGSGFYAIGAYEKELARRLFGKEEVFREIVKFLSIGKAYRELAAHAADYHDLFKRLLPEPKTDLFERIVDSLKSLEDSNNILEDMEKKHGYLESLTALTASIDDCREATVRYRWLTSHWALKTAAEEAEEISGLRVECESQSAVLAEDVRACAREGADLENRIADLKAKDSTGSVRLEKELTSDGERKDAARSQSERRLEGLETRTAESVVKTRNAEEAFRQAARNIHEGIEQRALPFGLGGSPLAHGLESLQDLKFPGSETDNLPQEEFLREIDQLLQGRRQADVLLGQKSERLQEGERLMAAEIARMEAEREIRPGRIGFSEAVSRLSALGIRAVTLYSELEWKNGLDMATASAAEEVVGEDVLFTLLIRGEDYERAREALLPEFPGIRLSRRKVGEGDVSAWVEAHFNPAESHPSALIYLSEEMEAAHGPVLGQIQGRPLASFRAHEVGLFASPSRWIGGDRRRRAWEEKLSDLRKELKELHAGIRAAESEIRDLRAAIGNLEGIKTWVTGECRRMLRLSGEWARYLEDLERNRDASKTERRILNEAIQEANFLKARLEDLRALIRREGLDGLEDKIAALETRRSDLERKRGDLQERQGACKQRMRDLEDREALRMVRERAAAGDLEVHSQALRRIHPELEDVDHYVLRIQKGFQFKNAVHVSAALQEVDRKENLLRGVLREKLNAPLLGSLFGFDYDETGNRLTDRRGRAVRELTAEQRRTIDEQREVINERTTNLFKRIIGTELTAYFTSYVARLEQMVRQINSLLAGRDFGGTRYGLELQREDKYKAILDAVRKSNPLAAMDLRDGGLNDDLRNFIEDNRDGILNAEVGTIPEPLDYRNWFHYHLRFTAMSGQGVLMDRKTKSLGSGGEQAVPNYLLILSIARFLFHGNKVKVHVLLFDEAFYGIDAGRRDQLLGFAGDLGLQLFVASPDQDGVKKEIKYSTTLLVVKDKNYDVHLYPFQWENDPEKQMSLLDEPRTEEPPRFEAELGR